MKNFKILLFTILSLLTFATLSACVNGTEEPEIKIHSGSYGLNPIYYGDKYNKEQEEIEERLKDFMIGKRFSDLPTVAYGDKVQIEPLNFETDEIEIYHYVLDQKANIISEYDMSPLSITSFEEGIATFIFEKSNNIEGDQDFVVEEKLVHSLLIRSEIDGNSFAFATLLLGEQ